MGYCSSLGRMAAWCLILLTTFMEITIHATPSLDGFISIDCGIDRNTSYNNTFTGLTYVSDDQYIDTGQNQRSYKENPFTSNVYAVNQSMFDTFITLRNFPFGVKNGYTLQPVTRGSKYLVRAIFYYGNYDNLNRFPEYPSDPYDRLWFNYLGSAHTATTSTVTSDTYLETPSEVLQTAILPSQRMDDVIWTADNTSTIFFVVLHFCEIQVLQSADYRGFYVYINDQPVDAFSGPKYLQPYWRNYTLSWSANYNVSVKPFRNSTLPPIFNAFEMYRVEPVTLLPTYTGDVIAITAIKTNYSVNKGWSGDPCVPTSLSWTGVGCTFNAQYIAQITILNLSSSELAGSITPAFGNLTALRTLDLSRNNLSGSIPSSLDQLTVLTFLDLSGNNRLNFALPPGLKKREDNGLLTVKLDDSDLCRGSGCDKKKSLIIIIVPVTVVFVLILAGILIMWRKRKSNVIRINQPRYYGYHGTTPLIHDLVGNQKAHGNKEHVLQSRQFSFTELKMITNNFHDKIATGGFGSVFVGHHEDRKVAVKLRSNSSSQGFNEFMTEAQNLARVHHKNLVSQIGYCTEGDSMALVYEYMPEGTLQDKLRDTTRPLTWKQRLRIAYESAQGLEYLHKLCDPPLIHRDVKSNNILLSANLEAKIADFGLVRAFDKDATSSHISTRVVGTPGYLDPDYFSTSQLTEKSDVYSFGVVLLEIVTGQPPIIGGKQHITELVRQRLFKGDIESIIDERLEGQYDINSAWKVAELGLNCTAQVAKRPTMMGVVAELKESMNLELSSEGTGYSGAISGKDNMVSDASHDSIFEMAYMSHTNPSIR